MNNRSIPAPQIIAFFALLAFTTVIASCGTTTVDKDTRKSEAMQIDSFEISSLGHLDMGGKVIYAVRGTPGGTASVLMAGDTQSVYLKEVEDGVYRGDHRIHQHSGFFPHAFARATLTKGRYSVSADQKMPME